MRYFDVVMYATVQEVISVGARDEDEAVEAALEIVKAGYVPCKDLYWEVEEINVGDPSDVTE